MSTDYNPKAFAALLLQILETNISEEALIWLNSNKFTQSIASLNTAFVLMPRKTGKSTLTVSADQQALLSALRLGLSIKNWTADRLGRVLLLLKYCLENSQESSQHIESLFATAELNEQVALYSALSVFPDPENWVRRCTEGIRSNISPILEAIMYNNPYAAENLNEAAWNQMVLKAFFTEKRLDCIYGVESRANPELARILIDYAKERRAAGREVPKGLLHMARKFVDPDQLRELNR